MSLEKAILHKKTRRKPHRVGSGACLNHGSCSYCFSNRMIRTVREMLRATCSKADASVHDDFPTELSADDIKIY